MRGDFTEALESGPQEPYRQFFERSADLHCIAGFDGYFKQLNPGWQRAFGYPMEELLSRPFLDIVHPDDRESTTRVMAALAEGADTTWFENRCRRADGSYRWLLWSAVSDAQNSVILATARDITENKQAEEANLLHRMLTRSIGEAEDLESALGVVLRGVCESTGWELGEAWMPNADETVLALTHTWHSRVAELESFRAAGKSQSIRRGQGEVGSAWATSRPARIGNATADPDFTRRNAARDVGIRSGVVIPVVADGRTIAVLDFFTLEVREQEDRRFVDVISAVAAQLGILIRRKQAEDRVAHLLEEFRELSLGDELTGLLNRRGFINLAEHHLALARRDGREMTLLYVDLDVMKQINDAHGHEEGDRALREVAHALEASFRESDVVARLGGDEFCVLLDGAGDAAAASTRRLHRTLADGPRDRPYEMSVSVGWARYLPEDDVSLQDLLAKADRRLYEMKDKHLATPGLGRGAGLTEGPR